MTGPQRHVVENPINRYGVGDRSGLVPNADGSIDIYIQQATRLITSPTGCQRRRAYHLGPAIVKCNNVEFGSKGTKIKTHLLVFTLGVIVAWGLGTYAYICFFPRALYNASGNRRLSP